MTNDDTRTGQAERTPTVKSIRPGCTPYSLLKAGMLDRSYRAVGGVLALAALPPALLMTAAVSPAVVSAADRAALYVTLAAPAISVGERREASCDPANGTPPAAACSPAPSAAAVVTDTAPQRRAPTTSPGAGGLSGPVGLHSPMDEAAARMPAVPWTLHSSRLVLRNSVFRGVVTVETVAGPKRVLKFTARSVDIDDLDVRVNQGSGTSHLKAEPGTTSTIAGETVTMYTERLTGTITGLEGSPLPSDRSVTLTPDSLPPWLFDPVAAAPISSMRTLTFQEVTVSQAGQSGGDLTIPGLRLHEAGS
ncbi:hypothetical protein [Streptomyces sp. NPDC001820]|uniref:hypothetical protein n=1 Tax=Streptomyces sp. NPDC001820 TaxID=3364613 RepID=UPI003676C53F